MTDVDFQDKADEIKKLKSALKEKDILLAKYQKQLQNTHKIVDEVASQLALELKIANQVHDALMPTELPLIPNCEFSFKFHPAHSLGTHTGGGKDFYDIFPHGKKGFTVLMSSCETNSMSSLLLSAKLRMHKDFEGKIFKETPHHFLSLLKEEMLKELQSDVNQSDKQFREVLKKMDFICVFVNQKTYELFYYLTGNIKAYAYFSRQEKLKEMEADASVFDDSYKDHSVNRDRFKVSLNQKDRIIICSPGILDCQNPYGESFPQARLEQIIVENRDKNIHQLRHQVFFHLEKFSQGRPFSKDQSFLVFEVKNNILKLATP